MYGIPGTLNNNLFNGCLVKQPFSYVMTWNHPVETTIKKNGCLEFQVFTYILPPKNYPKKYVDKFEASGIGPFGSTQQP